MHFIGVERYWNPYLGTLPPKQLRDFQFKKFKRIVEWGYKNSKLYRRLYDQAGFNPDKLQGWEDISRVPILQKRITALLKLKSLILMVTVSVYRSKRSQSFTRPAGLPDSRFTSRIPGKTGSGGMKAGRMCYGRWVFETPTGYLSPLAIMYIWAPGPDIMPVKK